MFTAFTVQVCQLLLRCVEQGARLSPDQRGWAFRGNRIAVRFAHEWHGGNGNWLRSYGNENWEFDRTN